MNCITLVEKNPQLEYLTFSDINNEVSDVNVSESLHGVHTVTRAHLYHSITGILMTCLFIRHLASTLKLTCPIPFEVANLLETLKVPSEPSSSDSDFSGYDIVSDGEYTCELYLVDEKVKSARDNSCDSDSSQYELDSSELSQGVQGIDDRVLFIDNIDTECLPRVNDTCFGDVDVDDDGCNYDDGCENEDDDIVDVEDDGCKDDDGCDDDVVDDDDKDEDNNANESFVSSDSEDTPLAKLKKLKLKT